MGGHASLRFLPSGTPEGFASKAVSSDNDANPSVIVRELIQNSLDAAAPPGSQVQVDFVFDELPVSDIPGIDVFRSTFHAAKRTNAHSPEAAEAQIERISESLNRDRIPVLQIIDNGIGLDALRTNALLSDGLTNKIGQDARSAGSYGLGHYTAFPASDLQYVLYGGVTAAGHRTMSGHAILASHFDSDSQLLGKDGYFIRGDPRPDIRNRYRFAENDQTPAAVNEVLDRIQSQTKHGSVVTLLAFNNFRDSDDPADAVLRVAARHFYPVIRTGHLVVRTERSGQARLLDDSTAETLLRSGRTERRSRADSINGSKAYAIWRTLHSGQKRDVHTDFGKIRLFVRPADTDESTRISLYRSGMFITDSIPLNRPYHFAQYRRFNAVILINTPPPEEDSTAFDLIRQAEGEKHASIDKKRLPTQKRIHFDRLFRGIRRAIKFMATKDDMDVYSPQGFMELEITADAERTTPTQTKQRIHSPSTKPSTFTRVPEHMEILPGGPRVREPSPRRKPSPKPVSKKTGRRIPVSASARLSGKNIRLVVQATEDIANATLRLLADQGADASCTNPLADQPLKSRVAGKDSSFVQEVRVGKLQDGQRREIDVELQSALPQDVVLKVDVLSRTESKKISGKP